MPAEWKLIPGASEPAWEAGLSLPSRADLKRAVDRPVEAEGLSAQFPSWAQTYDFKGSAGEAALTDAHRLAVCCQTV
jgi:hypothetical protein